MEINSRIVYNVVFIGFFWPRFGVSSGSIFSAVYNSEDGGSTIFECLPQIINEHGVVLFNTAIVVKYDQLLYQNSYLAHKSS